MWDCDQPGRIVTIFVNEKQSPRETARFQLIDAAQVSGDAVSSINQDDTFPETPNYC